MKKIFRSLAIIFAVICFISCASNPENSTEQTENQIKNPETKITSESEQLDITEAQNESEITEEIEPVPLFDDWKYMGFGAEIPSWVEAVLNNDADTITSLYAEIPSENLYWGFFYGENADQALNNKDFGIEKYEILDSFWVRFTNPDSSDKSYASVFIWIQNN